MEHSETDSGQAVDAEPTLHDVTAFARDTMRPAGIELDLMRRPEAVIEATAKLWDVLKAFRTQGFHRAALARRSHNASPPAWPAVLEALGSGDAGLALALNCDTLPFVAATSSHQTGLQSLAETYTADVKGELIGCWVDIPSPSSSQHQTVDNATDHALNLTVNGVINGAFATHALLTIHAPDRSSVAVIPMNQPGIVRGSPTNNIGLRSLNLSPITFNDVRIEAHHIIHADEPAQQFLACLHSDIGRIAVGLAQAALEEAVSYAKQRIQGGVPIIQHNIIKLKLFNMFAAIASSRALAQHIRLDNGSQLTVAETINHAIALRTTATDTALNVTSEAVQVLGGYGLSKQQPLEKMLRDASTLAGVYGNNEALSLTAMVDQLGGAQ